jgi:hypothetical protein
MCDGQRVPFMCFAVSLQGIGFAEVYAIPEMNGPKSINGQEAAARYSLGSFIRGSAEKFTTSQLLGIRRIPVSVHANLDTLRVCQLFLLVACVIPVAAVGGAVVATYLLGSTIKYTPNLFLCAVVLSSWLGGLGAGTFSVLLSAIAMDYYFIPPIYALGISLEETPDMILFVSLGLFVNWLNERRNQTKKSLTEEHNEKSAVTIEKITDLGKEDSVQPKSSNGESACQRLVQTRDEAFCAKCIKNVNGLPSLPADGGQADEDRRRESRPQTQGPDKPPLAVSNSARELLMDPRTSSCQDPVICKDADYWTIQHDGQIAWLKATRGLESLAFLLGHPGREFHVGELIGSASLDTGLDPRLGQQVGRQMRTPRLQDAGPILDVRAKAEYKLRLAELRTELEEAERLNDSGRLVKLQEEADAIAKQLALAVGLGGRDRKAASQAERARTAVTKRIRGSIKRIAKITPPLGQHLAVSIKTGYFCSYNPDPERPVRWKSES